MHNCDAPFLTYTNARISPKYMGDLEELAALNRRTEAIDKAIREGREFDVVLDMLEEDGQDAAEYVEQVGQNIEIIIAQNIVPEDIEVWRQRYHDG